jgi:hypothetical protein
MVTRLIAFLVLAGAVFAAEKPVDVIRSTEKNRVLRTFDADGNLTKTKTEKSHTFTVIVDGQSYELPGNAPTEQALQAALKARFGAANTYKLANKTKGAR